MKIKNNTYQIVFFAFLFLQNSRLQKTTLREFAIVKGGIDSPSTSETKKFYIGLYMELEFESSEPLFTLQYGTITSFKFYAFRLKELLKEILPENPAGWISLIESSTREKILEKLKSTKSISANKVITAIDYPSNKVKSLPIVFLHCQGDESAQSADFNKNLKLSPQVEIDLLNRLVKEKRLGFSLYLKNIKMFRRKETGEDYYHVMSEAQTVFQHYDPNSSLFFFINFDFQNLNSLNPTSINFATNYPPTEILSHNESSTSSNQYLSTLASAIEKSITSHLPTTIPRNRFKIPTISSSLPISTTAALQSYSGEDELTKYHKAESIDAKLNLLLNSISKKNKLPKEGTGIEVSKSEKKVLKVFGDLTEIKSVVKGFDFSKVKIEKDGVVVTGNNGKKGGAWKWVLGIVLSLILVGVCAGVGWVLWKKYGEDTNVHGKV